VLGYALTIQQIYSCANPCFRIASQQGAKVTVNVRQTNIQQLHVKKMHVSSSPTRMAATHVMQSFTQQNEFDYRWENVEQQARMQYRSTKHFTQVRSEARVTQDAQDVCQPATVDYHPPRYQPHYRAIHSVGSPKQGKPWWEEAIGVAIVFGLIGAFLFWLSPASNSSPIKAILPPIAMSQHWAGGF